MIMGLEEALIRTALEASLIPIVWVAVHIYEKKRSL